MTTSSSTYNLKLDDFSIHINCTKSLQVSSQIHSTVSKKQEQRWVLMQPATKLHAISKRAAKHAYKVNSNCTDEAFCEGIILRDIIARHVRISTASASNRWCCGCIRNAPGSKRRSPKIARYHTANLNSKQLFPTPESPISTSLNRKS